MELSAFIGPPDWRSAVLAVLFALPWLALVAGRPSRRPALWLAVAVGAALFPVSIAWIQVPIQQGLGNLWLRLLDLATIRRYLLLVGLPGLLVGSLVQEGTKLLVAIGGLWLARERGEPGAGLAYGAAAGAGYGGFEAFWVFNLILASGWSWATVQLAGPQALLGFVERLFAVPFHVAVGALSAYGYASGRPWRFLLLSVGVHTLLNYSAIMLQAGLLGALAVELWAAVVAVAAVGAAIRLRQRPAPVELPAAPEP